MGCGSRSFADIPLLRTCTIALSGSALMSDQFTRSRLCLLLLFYGLSIGGWALSVNNFVTTYPKRSVPEHETSSSSLWFKVYNRAISPIDGDRCRMSPSCSHYSREAIYRLGALKGVLMTLDRLQRCGYDLDSYPRVYEDRMEKFWDPVPFNSKNRKGTP